MSSSLQRNGRVGFSFLVYTVSKNALVPVRKRPWHAWLPVGYGVSVSIRHFHLRQRRLGEDFILLNHTVLVEQERGERVHLVRLERAFLLEGHAAIDVVPNDRRVRRMQRHYISRSNAWRKAWRRALHRRFGLDQHGSKAARTLRSVAHRAFLGVNRRALFCRSLPRWKILPVRADGDILGANLIGRRGLSDAIGRRLGPRSATRAQNQRRKQGFKSHCARSHRRLPATAESCCPSLGRRESCNGPPAP